MEAHAGLPVAESSTRRRRLGLGALAAVALVAGSAALGFGPLVRWRVRASAEARGLVVDVERVRPSWLGVELRGVSVELEGVRSVRLRFESVQARWAWSGTSLLMSGGKVRAEGEATTVVRDVQEWRRRHRSSGGGAGRAGTLSIAPLEVEWRESAVAGGASLDAKGVTGALAEAEARGRASEMKLVYRGAVLQAKGLEVALVRKDEHWRLGDLKLAELTGAIALGAATSDVVREVDRGSSGPSSEKLGFTARVRGALVSLAERVEAVLDPSAVVAIDALALELSRADDVLRVGPGKLLVRREGGEGEGWLRVSLQPGATGAAGAGERALLFRADIPRGATASREPAVLAVEGGPISLATLGAREGDLGLRGVRAASVEANAVLTLPPDGELRAVGSAKLTNLSLEQPMLGDGPIGGLTLAAKGSLTASPDGGRFKVVDGEVSVGLTSLRGSGEIELFERPTPVGPRGGPGQAGAARRHARGTGTFEVPLTACQSVLDSIPRGLAPRLEGVKLAGSFGIKGHLTFDTEKLEKEPVGRASRAAYDLGWDATSSCRFTEVPAALSAKRFRSTFRHVLYGPDGRRTEADMGPGSATWAPLGSISPFMQAAVLTTEDGGFMRHNGFEPEAIRNSIRENLRARSFVRGASTISMQLAKNLYLDRKKNLSRKLQEAVLTMYLEQELTKEQILELYLNIVELGPMVYGVGPAARHYFHTAPSALALSQAFYLATLLPNPKRTHVGAGGAVTAGWSEYLRKLIKIARQRNRITDEEAELGLRETVVVGQRTPLRSSATPAGEGEAEPEEPMHESFP